MSKLNHQIDLKDAIAAIPVQYDRIYSRCKLASDPLYEAVLDHIKNAPEPELPLLDIGCGMGLLAFYLRDAGLTQDLIGLDYDPRKTKAGTAVAEKLSIQESTRFFSGDARSDLPDHSGHVTILDILQFMPTESQRQVLKEAASRVAPGGRLIIRSGLNAPGWRFRVTVFIDYVARAARWMKEAPKQYPSQDFFEETLESEGLEVTVRPLWGKTPFHNYLITGTRP